MIVGIIPSSGKESTGLDLWPTSAEVETMAPHFEAIFAAYRENPQPE